MHLVQNTDCKWINKLLQSTVCIMYNVDLHHVKVYCSFFYNKTIIWLCAIRAKVQWRPSFWELTNVTLLYVNLTLRQYVPTLCGASMVCSWQRQKMNNALKRSFVRETSSLFRQVRFEPQTLLVVKTYTYSLIVTTSMSWWLLYNNSECCFGISLIFLKF